MRRTFQGGLAAIALLLAGSAAASAPGFDYVELRRTSIDSGGIDISGFGLGLVKSAGETTHVLFEYDDMSMEFFGIDIGVRALRAGVGGHYSMSETSALLVELTYESLRASAMGASEDANGFGLRFAGRARVSEMLELNGGLRLIELEGVSDELIGIGAVLHFTDQFGVSAAVEDGADQYIRIGARLSF